MAYKTAIRILNKSINSNVLIGVFNELSSNGVPLQKKGSNNRDQRSSLANSGVKLACTDRKEEMVEKTD